MRAMSSAAAALLLLATAAVHAQTAVKPWTAAWNPGSEDCATHPQPPLEVHQYDAKTFVLRENLCSTWEAPFMYLLLGDSKALLIDTGDVADPKQMPLAQTVLQLKSQFGSANLPLLVVHTHRHQDHRAADPQFAHLPDVQVVGYDLASVQQYFGLTHWPEGQAQIDLGNRILDVLPAPGHEATHVVFHDRNTKLLFSGDFMLPGRLLIEDWAAGLASARRVAEFVRNRPVSGVLGGHIEEDVDGRLFPAQATFHPREHSLPMAKADLLALPATLQAFNGFYLRRGKYVVSNPIHNLIAVAAGALIVLAALVSGAIYLVRRLKRRRANARPGVVS